MDQQLHGIMKSIHKPCVDAAETLRHAGQLRSRCERRRLHEGRQRHDRPGRRLGDGLR
ncbi:MAG: hypothetical protein MZV70_22650 [Desulfobacterales bacterium]|nr:hypothetical protein [Desulfobacterales bacterium]